MTGLLPQEQALLPGFLSCRAKKSGKQEMIIRRISICILFIQLGQLLAVIRTAFPSRRDHLAKTEYDWWTGMVS